MYTEALHAGSRTPPTSSHPRRVYTEALHAGSWYKSLLVSERSDVTHVIGLVLGCAGPGAGGEVEDYRLVQVGADEENQIVLDKLKSQEMKKWVVH